MNKYLEKIADDQERSKGVAHQLAVPMLFGTALSTPWAIHKHRELSRDLKDATDKLSKHNADIKAILDPISKEHRSLLSIGLSPKDIAENRDYVVGGSLRKEISGLKKSKAVLLGLAGSAMAGSGILTYNALKKQASEDSDARLRSAIGATPLGLIGLNLGVDYAGRAIDSGDLTGRLGLYHGTSADRADQIRKTGLRPGVNPGVTDLAEIAQGSKLGAGKLAFTTRSPDDARSYAIQQEYLLKKNPQGEDIRKFITGEDPGRRAFAIKHGLTPRVFSRFYNPTTLKISIPESHGIPTVENPEIANVKRGIFYKLNPAMESFVRDAEKNHVVFDGEVPTRYIKGSADYQGLTRKEFLDHIKANPQRFAKGIGKVLAGTGVAIGSGPAAYFLSKRINDMQKEAAEQYHMPLSKAIEEHKRLVDVLRSNNRKLELRELEEQGDELKEMQGK